MSVLKKKEQRKTEQKSVTLFKREKCSINRIKEDCSHQIRLERERRALLEEHNNKLTHQVNDLESKYSALMNSFYEYRNQQSSRPEIRLEAELNLSRLEKTELERKLETTIKSKLHYKQQWGRALKELALMKKREQDHALANLKLQQEELEQLKQQFASSNDYKTMQDEREKVKQLEGELKQMKEQRRSEPSIAIQPARPCEDQAAAEEINERVSRLMEEKDTLLRTGVYNKSDRIITELDKQINEILAQGTT